MANADFTVADVLSDAEILRTTGDILADELSVLNHTTGISGTARDALTDWDAYSFKLRTRLKELSAKIDDFRRHDALVGLATSCLPPAEKSA